MRGYFLLLGCDKSIWHLKLQLHGSVTIESAYIVHWGRLGGQTLLTPHKENDPRCSPITSPHGGPFSPVVHGQYYP